MSEGKVGVDYVVEFPVRLGTGLPATGIAPGDFTPTVRALDTATDDGSVAAVVEIGGGRYSLIIRGAFTTAETAGNYAWAVSVASTTPFVRDIIGDTIRFLDADEDDLTAGIAAVQADTDDIQSRLPAALVGGAMDSDVSNIQNDVITAASIAAGAIGASEAPNLDAAVSSRESEASASARAATNQAEHDATQALIALLNNPTVAAIADAVWDENVVAAHGAASAAGLLLRVLGEAISTRVNNGTLNALLGVADTPGTDLPEQIDTELSAAHGAGAWDATATVPPQTIRDAMKLAPTGGAPAAGSVDEHLDDILADTAAIEPLVTLNLDATVSSRESAAAAAVREANILAAITALNNLSITDVQTALTNQGYTVARAGNLDNLDAAISTVLTAISALNDLSSGDVDAAITANAVIVLLRKVTTNRRETNPSTGRLDIYNDADTAVEFSVPIFEDVGGTQGYQGAGADRQNKIV